MGPEVDAGEKLETASALGEAFTGEEGAAGRKDAIWHVARFIESQDSEQFNDSYRQLTDPEDNEVDYIANFKSTVQQLTDLIAFGKTL